MDTNGKQQLIIGTRVLVVRNAQEKNAKVRKKQVHKNKFPVHNLLSLLMHRVMV